MSRTVSILDTTLRDGEQTPGASLGPREKLQVALQLERLGVDAVEAGFPASSAADAEAVELVAREVPRIDVVALARAVEGDIRAAAAAIAPAGDRGVLHVFLGTSPHQRRRLGLEPEGVVRQVREAVALAASLAKRVIFSAEDASRTEPEFLEEVFAAALEAGAWALDVPDTVGACTPDEFAARVGAVAAAFPGVPLQVHCHDDLGLATANSLAGLRAGASAVHCTLNGLGERAGNCPLEELAVLLALKPELGLDTRLRLGELHAASRLVAQLTGIPVPRNKAVVGTNAYSHEAGVHQDGLLKDRDTYEFVHPELIGRTGGYELVLGRHSGRAGFVDHLVRLGLNLPPAQIETLYQAFMALAEKKKAVYDDDLLELLREHLAGSPRVWTLRALQVTTGNLAIPTATVRLEKDGEVVQDSATGEGPVEAALCAIDRMTHVPGEVKTFQLQALTRGRDALGEVSVQVVFEGVPVSAKGSDTDIVTASAKAYLNALNRHLFQKAAP